MATRNTTVTTYILLTSIALAVLLCISAMPAHAVDKPSADAIVAGIVNAYGGKDAIEKAKSVYVMADITATMLNDKGTYTRYLERDRKLRVETKYTKSAETRILNGDKGWRSEGGGGLEPVDGFRKLAMVYQYKQQELPHGFASGAYNVRMAGEGVVGDRYVYILGVLDKEGPPMDVYVDAKDYRILKVSGYFRVQTRNTDLSVVFSDFRKVDGLLVPFKATNYGSGRMIGETVIKDCKVNMKMKDSLFKP